ncbi:hypothetical protein PA7_48390 [Pseudonocardia asaccharolytica DSM 44247 = NBRC 16224]|uniref:Uncharacterized protein n=1 Tax=Pseudonocardia asaccharolytica DSM 44247 = NBRC 16224 TaxID=1123024 RepID=A0A511D899_9PSEU|nr:hypothetical protein PA7_48390 [Pseudonocardia asaccharolytica DSM 44247 = NBRC 16224]
MLHQPGKVAEPKVHDPRGTALGKCEDVLRRFSHDQLLAKFGRFIEGSSGTPSDGGSVVAYAVASAYRTLPVTSAAQARMFALLQAALVASELVVRRSRCPR